MKKFYGYGRIFIFACLGLGFLGGCSEIRRTLGIESKPSDEFVVSPSQKALEIPPDFTLLPPPAAGSKQELPSREQKPAQEEALLKNKPLTGGEKSMMAKIGPGLGLADQTQMDEEAAKEQATLKKKGFLGIGKKRKIAQKDLVDAQEELKRLKDLKQASKR